MITGREFRDTAVFLKRKDGPGSKRSQISRLYYAVFVDARHLCANRYGYIPGGKARDHQEIQDTILNKARDKTLYEDLGKLRDLRNLSDYRDQLSPNQLNSGLQEAYELASRISLRISALGGRRMM